MDAFGYGLILGAVEGLTEFLPISSTGHLVLASDLLQFTGAKAATFEVVIQLGAILAVVVLYRRRFWGLVRPRLGVRFAGRRGLKLLFLTTLPPCLVGLACHGLIKSLFSPLTVACSLAVGALCMLLVEHRGEKRAVVSLDMISAREALGIGCCQCLALWPGFSRAAATIMGGMLLGLRRKVATEYSFLAAVPLMCAATGYDLFRSWSLLSMEDLSLFVWGLLFSFVFAIVAIKGFIALLSRITLRPFAWYRLVLSAVVLCWYLG